MKSRCNQYANCNAHDTIVIDLSTFYNFIAKQMRNKHVSVFYILIELKH